MLPARELAHPARRRVTIVVFFTVGVERRWSPVVFARLHFVCVDSDWRRVRRALQPALTVYTFRARVATAITWVRS
jgi:hypothetical protein